MTPLYHNGTLYWVDGQSKVWAINADTGLPVAPFMDGAGQTVLTIGGGFNAISSVNVYQDSSGRSLMIVGNVMVKADLLLNNARVLVYAIDGATDSVRGMQRLDDGAVPSGFVAPTLLRANNRVHLGNPLAVRCWHWMF